MKNDYVVNTQSACCTGCGKQLIGHESIYSQLSWSQGKLLRSDFHIGCWRGLGENTIGFWKSRVQPQGRRKINFNESCLYEIFRSMSDASEEMVRKYRLVIALLLMYRKKFFLESIERNDTSEYLIFVDSLTKDRYKVISLSLSETEISDLQQKIEQMIV